MRRIINQLRTQTLRAILKAKTQSSSEIIIRNNRRESNDRFEAKDPENAENSKLDYETIADSCIYTYEHICNEQFHAFEEREREGKRGEGREST